MAIKKQIEKKSNLKKYQFLIFAILLLASTIGFFIVSITFFGKTHDIAKIFKVMFSDKLLHPKEDVQAQGISRSIWIVLAMTIGGMALAVTGSVAQSLTRNPLADASTLGTINATIFLIIISFSIGWIAFYAQFIFALIGGLIAALLLLTIIIFSKGRMTKTKFILIGLSISITFKAISFFFWKGDKGIGASYGAYIMGGAEKVFGADTYMPKPWTTLLISSSLIAGGIIVALINSKGMAVAELGEDKAKQLGISVTRVRVFNIISLILLVPASVMIVGNIAFIGLIATHVIRILFKTNDFKKIVPLTALIGIAISMLGLMLNILVPRMNSSIWITIIGAPMLIYLGWRRL